ncbi:hypothetical protein QJS10_CPA05g00020 [Acorus calamus]|uniref:Uncharacterized protein n=1 Tax=Acorus calamus TaxID=4465 RepID=A0AAV9ERS5_ACOCL|nr:hypothetical protein QJS10_CPA05g00020 [Acorus calamus]
MKQRVFKLPWVVSCASEKSVRTMSFKDIEEILKSRLAPIIEVEEEGDEEENEQQRTKRCPPENKKCYASRSAKRTTKVKRRFTSIGDCYVHCMIGFASGGNMRGLARF